jgi:hypothetical protein
MALRGIRYSNVDKCEGAHKMLQRHAYLNLNYSIVKQLRCSRGTKWQTYLSAYTESRTIRHTATC